VSTPHEFEGVKLEGKRSILKYLTAPRPADAAALRRLAHTLAAALPMKH